MDQSTQQNAALVEEVAATAQAMTEEVHAMMQAVGAFNLGELVLQPTFEAGRRQKTARQAPDISNAPITRTFEKPAVTVLPRPARRPTENLGDEWKSF